jgi:hypothetical protein
MDLKPEVESAWSYCEQLDRSLAFSHLRLEDADAIRTVLAPLETRLVDVSECPALPDSPGGRTGTAVWASLHPQKADLERLLQDGRDKITMVRFAAANALKTTLEAKIDRWNEPSFTVRAREGLQHWLEHEQSASVTFILKSLLDQSSKSGRPLRRTRAPLRLNPYVAGVPIRSAEKFFGRQDVLTEIAATLGETRGAKSLILCGARRSGKTSIMLRIKSGALGDSFLPVYVDMQGFAGVDANVFLASLAQTTFAAVLETGILVEQPQLPSLNAPEFRLAFQDAIKSLLETTPRTVLIMVDEYEVLLEYIKSDPSLALQLQHLVEGEGNLCFVFAGSHTIESLGRYSFVALLDGARYLRITFLSRESALELVTQPVQGLLNFAEGVPERIVELTSGHPFYIQLICQSLFDFANVSRHSVVTMSDLEQAVETFLHEPPPHLILTWNGLQHEEKVAGSTLAVLGRASRFVKPVEILSKLNGEDYPSVPKLGELRDVLRKLRDEGWINELLAEGTYRFSMELVRRWVEENRSFEAMVDEQRKRLASVSAPAWRQWSAELVDVLLSGSCAALGAFLGGSIESFFHPRLMEDWAPFSGAIITALFYFIFPMMAGNFTVGLRLFNLYPLLFPRVMPLRRPRAAIYGLGILLRVLVIYCTIACYVVWAGGQTGAYKSVGIALGILGTVVIVADNALMRIGPTRRGLYERLCGITIMYRK